MKMKVAFKDGRTVIFDANGWNFEDVENNNAFLLKDGTSFVHLNWSEVLFVEKVSP